MKNQVMKNQLAFNKNSLVELNDASLKNVESGVTPFILFFAAMASGVAVGNGLQNDD